MNEDSEIVMQTLRHVRDNYVHVSDGWHYDKSVILLTLARLNAEIARRIPQQWPASFS